MAEKYTQTQYNNISLWLCHLTHKRIQITEHVHGHKSQPDRQQPTANETERMNIEGVYFIQWTTKKPSNFNSWGHSEWSKFPQGKIYTSISLFSIQKVQSNLFVTSIRKIFRCLSFSFFSFPIHHISLFWQWIWSLPILSTSRKFHRLEQISNIFWFIWYNIKFEIWSSL